MIYIIGLAHRAQARKPRAPLTAPQETFAACLRHIIQKAQPAFVAEEDSEEALANRREVSIAREIAEENGIAHRFCDPNREQRRALGYKDGQMLEIEIFTQDDGGLSNDEIRLKARAIEIGRYFPVRENFWLERLNGLLERDGIFICGDGHVDGLSRLLQTRNVPYTTERRGIGLTEEDGWFTVALQHLKEHPELANGE